MSVYHVHVCREYAHGDKRPVWTARVTREDGSVIADLGQDRSIRDLLRLVSGLLRED